MSSKIEVYSDMLTLFSAIKSLRCRFEKVIAYQEKVEEFYKDPTKTILLPDELRWLLFHLDGFSSDFGNVIEIPEKYVKDKESYITNQMGVDDFESEFKEETVNKFEKNIKEKRIILEPTKEKIAEAKKSINESMSNVIKDEYEVDNKTAEKIADNIDKREVKPLTIGTENKRTIEEVIKLISDRIGIAIKTGKINMDNHAEFGTFLKRQKQAFKMLYPHLGDKIDIIYDQMIETTKRNAERHARA